MVLVPHNFQNRSEFFFLLDKILTAYVINVAIHPTFEPEKSLLTFSQNRTWSVHQ